jgi:hypothetical protein
MELRKMTAPAITTYGAQEVMTVAAGKSLKFRETGSEGHFLDVTVPRGKEWQVTVTVQVVETDKP